MQLISSKSTLDQLTYIMFIIFNNLIKSLRCMHYYSNNTQVYYYNNDNGSNKRMYNISMAWTPVNSGHVALSNSLHYFHLKVSKTPEGKGMDCACISSYTTFCMRPDLPCVSLNLSRHFCSHANAPSTMMHRFYSPLLPCRLLCSFNKTLIARS